jgi:hypothetical protein
VILRKSGARIVAGLVLVALGAGATALRDGHVFWGAFLAGAYLLASGASGLRKRA